MALATRRTEHVKAEVLGRLEVVLRAVAGVGEEGRRGALDPCCGEVLLGRLDHRAELVCVARFLGDLGGEDDLTLLVDHSLGVVRVVKPWFVFIIRASGSVKLRWAEGFGFACSAAAFAAPSISSGTFSCSAALLRAAASALSRASCSIASLASRSFARRLSGRR